jgi:precorrin-6A synthase
MRRLKLIGIGAGDPDYITVQAINALNQVDVVFVTDKGPETADLMRSRRQICERYMQSKPYRTVEIQDPERNRTGAYRSTVARWHEARASLYEQLLRDELSDGECGAFLAWGDPCLYDSTLRIVDQVSARGGVEFELEVIPGITSIQALAARHKMPLNQIAESIQITPGRQLLSGAPSPGVNVVVMLDGECAFKSLEDEDIEIFWGAYLGTSDEILMSGRLCDLKLRIQEVRAEARRRKGWIMDTYLLRKRELPR